MQGNRSYFLSLKIQNLTKIHEFTVPPNMVKVEDESAHPGISSGKHCDVPIEMYGEGGG